jgi:DNA-binding MarR family transcriptional regulator
MSMPDAAASAPADREEVDVLADADPARTAAVTALEAEFSELITHFRRLVLRNANLVSPGLLPGAYKAFTTIARCERISLSALAERMTIDKGQLSRSVRELEERGLIERTPDPKDGRVSLVSLTEFGTERLEAARVPQEGMLLHTVAAWSIDDLQNFTRLLHGLRTGMLDGAPDD